jgi:hypothetical protein
MSAFEGMLWKYLLKRVGAGGLGRIPKRPEAARELRRKSSLARAEHDRQM